MIYYHPDPMSWLSMDQAQPAPEYYHLRLRSGGIVSAELLDGMRLRVCSICSTDPADYLNPQWQPGQMVELITAHSI